MGKPTNKLRLLKTNIINDNVILLVWCSFWSTIRFCGCNLRNINVCKQNAPLRPIAWYNLKNPQNQTQKQKMSYLCTTNCVRIATITVSIARITNKWCPTPKHPLWGLCWYSRYFIVRIECLSDRPESISSSRVVWTGWLWTWLKATRTQELKW